MNGKLKIPVRFPDRPAKSDDAAGVVLTRYKCSKDLADAMELSIRSVKNWAKRLGVPPTVPGHACHRWSETDAQELLRRWEEHNKRKTPHYGPSRPTH